GLRILVGFTGTGLAQPNAPTPAITIIAGRINDPNRSTCGIGFSVNRPSRFAVSSPKRRATTPWLISWRMIATTRPTNSEIFHFVSWLRGGDYRRFDAQAMQSRAAGMASRRASAIGSPHDSHRP